MDDFFVIAIWISVMIITQTFLLENNLAFFHGFILSPFKIQVRNLQNLDSK